MFFSTVFFINKKIYQPLRVQLHTYRYLRRYKEKRTSQSASLKETLCSEDGSVTLETAMIIPLLLCVLIGILLWGKVFLIHQEIETALLESARQLARQEGILTMQDQEGTGILGVSILFSGNRKQGNKIGGVEVSSVSFLGSEYREATKELFLKAEYSVKIPILLLGTWKIPFKTSIVQKAWNGYVPNLLQGENSQYVYITEHGRSYHRASQCYHLHVTIEEVQDTEIYYNGGTAYRPCEFCVSGEGRERSLYISEDGECYHEELSCGGLTRTVRYVEIGQAAGRSPCADCCGGG